MRKSVICLLGVLGLWSCAQPGSGIAEETAAQPAPLAENEPPEGDCPCRGEKHAETPVTDERVDVDLLGLARAPSRGSISAPVTIAVFCDFECPYCARLKPRLQELQRTQGSNVRVVFKQLPLAMHEHARLAAKAALAAQDQGRFWELHDLMFQAEHPLDRERLESLATRAGLDFEH